MKLIPLVAVILLVVPLGACGVKGDPVAPGQSVAAQP